MRFSTTVAGSIHCMFLLCVLYIEQVLSCWCMKFACYEITASNDMKFDQMLTTVCLHGEMHV